MPPQIGLRRQRTALVTTAAISLGCGTAILLGMGPAASSQSTPGASTPVMGTIPSAAFTPTGIDRSLVPEYVPALDRQGQVVGYVRSSDIVLGPPGTQATPPTDQNVPVYDSSLAHIVGYIVTGCGFVPLGQQADNCPTVTTAQGGEGGG